MKSVQIALLFLLLNCSCRTTTLPSQMRGVLEDGVYHNDYWHFSVKIPAQWVILDNNDIRDAYSTCLRPPLPEPLFTCGWLRGKSFAALTCFADSTTNPATWFRHHVIANKSDTNATGRIDIAMHPVSIEGIQFTHMRISNDDDDGHTSIDIFLTPEGAHLIGFVVFQTMEEGNYPGDSYIRAYFKKTNRPQHAGGG